MAGGAKITLVAGTETGATVAEGVMFDRVYRDGMELVERASAYLDGEGRESSRLLTGPAALTYAAWSLDVTTRLMQVASWLVMQKSVQEGTMSRTQAASPRYRLRRESPPLATDGPDAQRMPAAFIGLVEEAEALFSRACRLDHSHYGERPDAASGDGGGAQGGPPEGADPVGAQLGRLREAADSGAFDPMNVWKGLR